MRQGRIRVDLGQNGMEAKMEEGLPKEEMVEEEVVMVLDTFFRHRSLT